MPGFFDRLKAAFTDFAMGWGRSGEHTAAVTGGSTLPAVLLGDLSAAVGDRYRIEEEIGSGGMALVYRALDRKHDRPVAVKILRPELASQVGRERFLREIRLAARLSHPHILPLHDSGAAGSLLFYVMPLVEGESLRGRIEREGRLPVEEAVPIARAVAGALDFAHRQNVVHRDVKPGNIMMHAGVAMVTDFGIGKALSELGADHLTQPGTAMGTPAYMSPEQMYGDEEVDGRSDIYSLGLVVYEMVTGERLYSGPSPQAILARRAAAGRPQIPTDLPDYVRAALHTVLAESPADRPRTGAQFADLLSSGMRTSAGVTPVAEAAPADAAERSIAVLPFANMSGDAENEYLSDGMTEEIIGTLTRLEGLHVAARTSSFAFKGQTMDVQEVGRRLRVRTVLEGSVRQAGNRLRITAQLINALDGYQLWSERWDRELDDVFAVQDEIAAAIGDRFKVLASGNAPLVKRTTDDLDAYQLYLKGRYLWARRTQAGLRQAVECFQQAIARDADYALAYSGLADAYLLHRSYKLMPRDEAQALAKAAAEKALALDDTLAEAHTSFGQVLREERDWAGEEREYVRAIALNPDYPTAHQWYATLLAALGRMKEAVREVRRAEELDPLSHAIAVTVAIVLHLARDVSGAMRQLQKALELEPDFPSALGYASYLYAEQGMFDEAVKLSKRLAQLSGTSSSYTAHMAAIQALRGDADSAREGLERAIAEGADTGAVAFAWIALGDFDRAFESLERAVDENSWFVFHLKVHPALDAVRGDPRFPPLLERMGLADPARPAITQ